MNIKKIKPFVYKVLMTKPSTRDNDQELLAIIWGQQFKKLEQGTHFINFLEALKSGKLTPAESITRARRKIQEQNPATRGKSYYQRQEHQSEIKGQLRAF